jgi:uncharacterized protein YdaU (DUF1376 family)
MRNPPAFQCYASDSLASEEFKMASLEERGLVFTMIMQCWVSGSVPRNPPELAKLLGLELVEVTRALNSRVLRFFEEENDRLIRRELVEQKETMMERREQQSQGGKTGANRRWARKKRPIAKPLGNPSDTPLSLPEEKRVYKRGGEVKKNEGSYYLNNSKSDDEELLEYKRAFGEIS